MQHNWAVVLHELNHVLFAILVYRRLQLTYALCHCRHQTDQVYSICKIYEDFKWRRDWHKIKEVSNWFYQAVECVDVVLCTSMKTATVTAERRKGKKWPWRRPRTLDELDRAELFYFHRSPHHILFPHYVLSHCGVLYQAWGIKCHIGPHSACRIAACRMEEIIDTISIRCQMKSRKKILEDVFWF